MVNSGGVLPLSSKKSFRKLAEQGKRARSGSLSLIYRLDESQDTINVAYSVGKKVGKAVVRNKIKRRLRSLVRDCSDQLIGGDYLVIVSPKVVNSRFSELRDEIKAILPLKGRP